MTERVLTVARDAGERIEGMRDEFVELLRELVEAESPSTVPESQAAVRTVLERELRDLGFDVEHIPGETTGGILRATISGTEDHPRQLILAHMDTVWDLGTLETMPAEVEGETFSGPGTFDMKGGIAMALIALRALRQGDHALEVAPIFMITSDEEIGSPESADAIVAEAKGVERVFVVEPGLGLEGLVKTRRKGVGHFIVEVHGVSAHGGLAPEDGSSAVLELARLIGEIDALQDPERGITLNVGVIEGGTRANVVPDYARAEVDARAWSAEDAGRIDAAIRAFEPADPRRRIEIGGGFDRGPLEKTPANARLWERARRIGAELGIDLEEGAAGGASDGNFTSAWAATLDGIGAVGDGAHADHEHLLIDRSLERTAILAGLLALPAGAHDDGAESRA